MCQNSVTAGSLVVTTRGGGWREEHNVHSKCPRNLWEELCGSLALRSLPWVGGIVGFAQDMAGALGFSSMLEKPLQNIF